MITITLVLMTNIMEVLIIIMGKEDQRHCAVSDHSHDNFAPHHHGVVESVTHDPADNIKVLISSTSKRGLMP